MLFVVVLQIHILFIMNNVHVISVKDHMAHTTLVTREAATSFMLQIKKLPWNTIELDFSNIEFISRSFADQLHKEKIELWEANEKKVNVSNACEAVFQMLQAVSKTQNKPDRVIPDIEVLHFNDRKSLKAFLSSL